MSYGAYGLSPAFRHLPRAVDPPRPDPWARAVLTEAAALPAPAPRRRGRKPRRERPISDIAPPFPIVVGRRAFFADAQQAACAQFGISLADMLGPRRFRVLVRARWAAWLVGHRQRRLSIIGMARRTGGRDHTTALHGLRQAEELVGRDAAFADAVRAIEASLVGVP